MAKYNLDYGNQMEIDERYLMDLSSDAMPVILENRSELGVSLDNWYFERIENKYEDMNIRTFNLSVFVAGSMLAGE